MPWTWCNNEFGVLCQMRQHSSSETIVHISHQKRKKLALSSRGSWKKKHCNRTLLKLLLNAILYTLYCNYGGSFNIPNAFVKWNAVLTLAFFPWFGLRWTKLFWISTLVQKRWRAQWEHNFLFHSIISECRCRCLPPHW